MRCPRLLGLLAALCLPAAAQTSIEVGSGAPHEVIRRSFVAAYFRGGFAYLVSWPPLAEVKRFGATGLVQEFQDAAKSSGVKYALVKADTTPVSGENVIDVFQVHGAMYAYYNTIGVNTAGYPNMDTRPCGSLADTPCTYQTFDKNYVLFSYQTATLNGQNFSSRDPFFTRWSSLGGLAVLGPAISAETAVTSSAGGNATLQTYSRGAIFNITSGLLNGRLLSVRQPVYDVYVANGGHAGFLGFPAGEEMLLPNGDRRQAFQGGSIDYSPGGGAVIRLPVNSVMLTPGGSPLRLKLGETVPLRATLFSANGVELSDRSVSFRTSNSRVAAVEGTGLAVVLRATGGGTAIVTAVSEGRISPPLTIIVLAPCCQAGEGAPTLAIEQAFQDAIRRARIAVQVPAPGPVRRLGAGYVQEFQGVEPNTSARYLVALADRSAVGYVVAGDLLSRYLELGGPAQALGYPTSDVFFDSSRAPRLLFQNGALAGNPVRLVTGPILQKWAALNFENGAAGMPVSERDAAASFTGVTGSVQTFRNGLMAALDIGPLAGKVFFVQGLALAKYAAVGGARGQLGFPTTDEFPWSGKRRQEFEGGVLEYSSGDAEATLIERERTPSVTATPAAIVAGGRVRIIIGGFPNGATLRVSMTGRPDFVVPAQTGSYSWEIFVPRSAASASVRIRAVDTAGDLRAAEAAYSVRSLAESTLRLVRLSGDTQAGAPGAVLAQPLRIALRDETGVPVAGLPVVFNASPGSQIVTASTTTDERGEAEARLRLPFSESVAVVSVEAGRQVTMFSARAARTRIENLPRFTQAVDQPLGNGPATVAQKGALLAAAASLVRFYQDRGDAPAPNGLADVATLNEFLRGFCTFDSQGVQICDGFLAPGGSQEQIVNLWRLPAFAGNALDIAAGKPDINAVRDLTAQGTPVLLALTMNAGDTPAGSHFVVAMGVGADGSVLVHDPNPAFARPTLQEYLNGFSAGGRAWKAGLSAALRLVPGTPAGTGFVMATTGPAPAMTSQAGECGVAVEWPAAPAIPDGTPASSAVFRQRYCDGTQKVYQIDIDSEAAYEATVTDLASLGGRVELAGAGAASFKATRPGTQLVISTQDLTLAARAVVNAATFTLDMAPGGLVAVFGSGLAKPGSSTKAEISGRTAAVVAALPFQINLQLPPDLEPGTHVLRVSSPYGSAEQPLDVQAVAPAIFRLDARLAGANRAAALNQDGSLNLPSVPARRGTVVALFATGLGAVVPSGSLMAAAEPVTALLDRSEVPVMFAGFAPGFLGLYQVNVLIPAEAPPGLAKLLAPRQGGVESAAAEISVE